MSKWQKEYPVDFSPHGDNQGQAVQKQDNEMTAIYEKLNKVLERRYSDWSSASDLERGEIIVKNGYKLTVQKNNRQTIINILKDGSVENDTNEGVNALGYEYVGRIPVLNFRSDLLGGYIRIAKVSSSPEAHVVPAPDVARRGGIEVSLSAADLLPSDVLPYTRDFLNCDSKPYPAYWRYRGVEDRQNKSTMYYSAQNNNGIYVIRYYFKLNDNHDFLFYIQNHQSDNSVYYTQNYWNNDGSKVITHNNRPCIYCSPSSLHHTGEIVYSPHQNMRIATIVGTSNRDTKWPAYLGGGRWRNTGNNVRDYLGYTWSGQTILHGIIVMEKVAW